MKALPATIRAEARRLRQEEGLSLGEIARLLDVAPATARRWTLDIELTPNQLAQIDKRRIAASRRASAAMAEDCRRRRATWQLEGRMRAREGNLLHQAGCLLYWAEGTKDRNTVKMVNSDINLLRLFRRFLSECHHIEPHQMTFRLHVYTGDGLTVREIEDHWLSVLELPRSCLRKHSINKRPADTSGVKKSKLPYGVGNLDVLRSTWLVQHIYGAIQEYGAFDEPRWID